MPRPFSIDPTEWPKIAKRAQAGETLKEIAASYDVGGETVRKIIARLENGELFKPKAKATAVSETGHAGSAAGNGAPITAVAQSGNGSPLKPGTVRNGVAPQMMECLGVLAKAERDGSGRDKARHSIDTLVTTLVELRAEL